MAEKCSLVPARYDKDGNLVESKVFHQLLRFFNDRAIAKETFLRSKDKEFIDKFGSLLDINDEGDYTFESMYRFAGLRKGLEESQELQSLREEFGSTKSGVAIHYKREFDAVPKMRAFNSSVFGTNYMAQVLPNNVGSYGLVISKKSKSGMPNIHQTEVNYRLNENLTRLLNSIGLGIGDLSAANSKKYNGLAITNINEMERMANGLLEAIQLAEGDRGQGALPEEASHIFIKAGKHLPLVKRLIDAVYNNDLAVDILGEDYQRYSNYYKGNRSDIAEEAAGKLMAQAMYDMSSIDALNKIMNHKVDKSFLQRVIDQFKKWFNSIINSKQVTTAIEDAKNYAYDYAKTFLHGDGISKIKLNNLDGRKMLNTTRAVNRSRDLLERIIEDQKKKLEIYGNVNKPIPKNPTKKDERIATFTQKQQILIAKLVEDLENSAFELGVYHFLDESLTELEKLDKRLIKVNDDVSATPSEKISVLMAIYNFTESFGSVLDDIRQELRNDTRSETSKYNPDTLVRLDQVQSLVQGLRVDFAKIARKPTNAGTPKILRVTRMNSTRVMKITHRSWGVSAVINTILLNIEERA